MTNIPDISVLITAYNVEKYIGRCVRSILYQSIPKSSYEVVVINDCSTDRTLFALGLFESDLRLASNEKQMGLPASLNRGIRMARGRYLVRLDGDDYVNHEFLKTLLMFLDMNPELDAVACDYLMVDDHENIMRKVNCQEEPIACGIMFRIEQLIDVGMYDETFIHREEEDLRIRFEKKYVISRIQLPLYRYRRHGNNLTNNHAEREIYKKMLHAKHGQKKGSGKKG